MKRIPLVLLVCAALVVAGACSKTDKADGEAKTGAAAGAAADPATVEDQKTIYAMGRLAAEQLTPFAFDEEERAQFLKGIEDELEGKGEEVKAEDYAQRIQGLTQSRLAILATNEKKKGGEYVAKVSAEAGARKLPSGMIYQETQAGSGATPKPMDGVRAQLKLSDIEGNVLESSLEKGEPVSLIVGNVFPCLSQGLQQMKAGGKAKLTCPAETAYGDQSPGGKIKPGQTLVFEVELLEVVADAGRQMGGQGGPQPPQ